MSPAARPTNRPRRRAVHHKRHYGAIAKWVAVGLVVAVVLQQFIYSGGGTPAKQVAKQPSVKTVLPIQKVVQPSADAVLDQIISTWAQSYSFTSSVVLQEVTGANPRAATYNQTASVVPASTYKIYVAYAILQGIEKGTYTLATQVPDGNTIQTDLSNMIVNSDNDAARTLGFLYGWKNINALLQSQGITHTDLYNYVPPSTSPVGDKHTTAADLALTLSKLRDGSLLNTTNTQLLLGLLEQQNYRQRIPAGVPSSVVVADKPGWLTGTDDGTTQVENDAAIVFGPKSTYILVITTTGSTTQPLANLSRLIYNQLET